MGSAAKPPKAPRVADLIGHTPLLRLDRLAAHVAPQVQVYAKAEFRNPGGSVKDRAALGMLRAAERSGLTKDRILLDATSGNTGIALAMIGASEGYRVTLCVPANLRSSRPLRTGPMARSGPPKRSRPRSRTDTGISINTTTRQTGGLTSSRPGRRSGSRPRGRSRTSSLASGPPARSSASDAT